MAEWMAGELRLALLRRQVCLWLGPSYGWSDDSRSLGRSISDADAALARMPWRAIFSDSPVPLMEQAVSNLEAGLPLRNRATFRRPLAVAKSGAQEGLITSQFLPIYYLQGKLQAPNREERYKGIPQPLRAAYRASLMLSMRSLVQEDSALVIVGCGPKELRPVLDELRGFVGDTLPILVLLDTPAPPDTNLADEHTIILAQTPQEFLEEIEASGLLVPVDREVAAHVLAGPVQVRIDDILHGPMGRLDEDFRVITSEALAAPPRLDRDIFESFMVLNESRDAPDIYTDQKGWLGFAVGLYHLRKYRAAGAASLEEYLRSKLADLRDSSSNTVQNHTAIIPAQTGAGTTMLLHHAAYCCAKEGYPTFILKQEAREMPLGQLSAALTDLAHRVRDNLRELNEAGKEKAKGPDEREVPCLLVFDSQHAGMESVLVAAKSLAAAGRKCVVLMALPSTLDNGDDDVDPAVDAKVVEGKKDVLNPLTPDLAPDEVSELCAHFESIRSRNPDLPLVQKTLHDWQAFQTQSSFKVLAGGAVESAESLFWVTLHFFVTAPGQDFVASGVQTSLGRRIISYAEEDPLLTKTLLDICRFSVNGLYVEWRLLGRLEGDTFSRSVLDRTRKLEADQILRYRWEEDTGGNLFRLRHRLYASLFLREALGHRDDLIRMGVPAEAVPQSDEELNRPLWMLVPLLKTLDGSVPGDIRLAEEISAGALRIGSQKELAWRAREDILGAFEQIPRIVRDSSRAINHHYAMALWKTAAYDRDLAEGIKSHRFDESIEVLDNALKIPPRTHERDEHPGHVLTTRGYALWHSSLLRSRLASNRSQLESSAISSFRDALAALPDNRYAVYGLARALVEICERHHAAATLGSAVADLLGEALDLLQGDTVPEFASNWFALQHRAIILVDQSAPGRFREDLRTRGEEAGYLLEAWASLRGDLRAALDQDKEQASGWLRQAFANPSVECTWRSYYLAYRLYASRPGLSQYASEKYELLRTLERMDNFTLRPKDLFVLGVLCYLLDRPTEGSAILRQLRISGAYKDLDMDVQPFWTEPVTPFRPRPATLQVRRVESVFRGWGYVPELSEEVPFTPAHFRPDGRLQPGEAPLRCYIRFSGTGAKAVPERFYKAPTQ